jgi:tetratricopeptide (TPR) repeat protein
MKVFKRSSIAIVLALMATTVFAQTKTDAIKLYNVGLEEANANNYEAAISSLTQALNIANQLGPDGEDIKNRAEQQIPTVYYRQAVAQYKEFQSTKSLESLSAAIEAFREVVQVGNEYGDDRVAPRAKANIPRLLYTKSVLNYSSDNLEAAMTAVDAALNENSNYATAYYHKAKIIKKQNDTDNDGIIDENVDELLNWYDQAIEKAEATDNSEIAEKAREAAHDELLAVGTRQSEEGSIDAAIESLNTALKYDNKSADVYYRLAEASNKKGNYNKAIEFATQALDHENGGKTDKAKIYFELGYAHQTLGNKSVACDAFSNALFGSFKSPAEHKMEYELKCDSTAD